MSVSVLVDTGPLIALFNTRDKHHEWAIEVFKALRPPLYTCDAVLAEAMFLLRSDLRSVHFLTGLLERNILISDFAVQEQAGSFRKLMSKYADTPMGFADASLVRMSELRSDCSVWTMDSDFLVYRRNGRARIPMISPN
ncbi:MAG: PIN domain-containing protein [Opitutales bacterium]|nr:PIN domain-containing protein [Opitutales bacterium]